MGGGGPERRETERLTEERNGPQAGKGEVTAAGTGTAPPFPSPFPSPRSSLWTPCVLTENGEKQAASSAKPWP